MVQYDVLSAETDLLSMILQHAQATEGCAAQQCYLLKFNDTTYDEIPGTGKITNASGKLQLGPIP